jgi:hypothetical protein
MADQEFPTGDDDNARARRKTGRYFMLPSELAEQFRRTEAELERPPDRTVEQDARLPSKDDD